jgi:hypothetical protein
MTDSPEFRTTLRVRGTWPRLAGLAAALLLLAVLGATARSADASAYGCSAWGAKTIGKYPVATGMYCVNIQGSGTHVKWVGGGFKSIGNVCNWSITAEFFDSAGRWYQTRSGPTHYGCARSANDVIWINATKKRGFMCSTLKTNGLRITSVCHNIF